MLFLRLATLTLLTVQASLHADAGAVCGRCEPKIAPVDRNKHIVEARPSKKGKVCGTCVEDDNSRCNKQQTPCTFRYKVFKKNGREIFETTKAQSLNCGESRTVFGRGVDIDGTLETFAVDIKCGSCDRRLLNKASCGGDPHFRTFHGQRFSFHGECDLVLLHSYEFGSKAGLDIHVRTESAKKRYSFVSEAAVRIGSDILEVANDGTYYVNGMTNVKLPALLARKYSVTTHTDSSIVEHKLNQPFALHNITQFDVDLENNQNIQIKVWKGMIWVEITAAREHLSDSVGLMGMWEKEGKRGRDGSQIMDSDVYGQEWQVNDTEPKLFYYSRQPQYPNKCLLPKEKSQTVRRLDEKKYQDKAETACKDVDLSKKDFCIFDVVATGDEEMALAYLV